MPKGTKNYFRHSIFMTTDPKVQQLVDDKGMEGYGRYIRMIELMAEQEIVDSVNGCYTFRKNSLRKELKLGKDSINTWLTYMTQVFHICVTTEEHLVRLEYRNVLKYIGSYDSSLYKVKESKRKENKLKESKLKEGEQQTDNLKTDSSPSENKTTETNKKDEFKREGDKLKGKKNHFFTEGNMTEFQKALYIKEGSIHLEKKFKEEKNFDDIIKEFKKYLHILSYEQIEEDFVGIIKKEKYKNLAPVEAWITIYKLLVYKQKQIEENL